MTFHDDVYEVGVSRQALEETLEKLETLRQENDRLRAELKQLNDDPDDMVKAARVIAIRASERDSDYIKSDIDGLHYKGELLGDWVVRVETKKHFEERKSYLEAQVLVLREALEYIAKKSTDSISRDGIPTEWQTLYAMTALLTTQPTYDAIVERVRVEAAQTERERILKLIDSQTHTSELGDAYRHIRGLVVALAKQEGEQK